MFTRERLLRLVGPLLMFAGSWAVFDLIEGSMLKRLFGLGIVTFTHVICHVAAFTQGLDRGVEIVERRQREEEPALSSGEMRVRTS